MNLQFRDHVFGTAFTLHLRENQMRGLAELCKDGSNGWLFDQRIAGALLARGLVTHIFDDERRDEGGLCYRYRPTRAGLLVFDLLVEAGEQKALDEKRRETIEAEHKLDQEEWDHRFGTLEIRRKVKLEPEVQS